MELKIMNLVPQDLYSSDNFCTKNTLTRMRIERIIINSTFTNGQEVGAEENAKGRTEQKRIIYSIFAKN